MFLASYYSLKHTTLDGYDLKCYSNEIFLDYLLDSSIPKLIILSFNVIFFEAKITMVRQVVFFLKNMQTNE